MSARALPELPHPDPGPDLSPTLAVTTGAPSQRRFLVMTSKTSRTVSWAWIDDVGTCQQMHPRDVNGVDWSKWHLYQFRPTAKGAPRDEMPHRAMAFRCPSTLENDESRRIRIDLPPGVMKDILQDAKDALNPGRRDESKRSYGYGDEG
jgi:hypothetical protein